MSLLSRPPVPLAVIALLATLSARAAQPEASALSPGSQAPDFALQDANPRSATFRTTVSVRDHEGIVSAWYFGKGT